MRAVHKEVWTHVSNKHPTLSLRVLDVPEAVGLKYAPLNFGCTDDIDFTTEARRVVETVKEQAVSRMDPILLLTPSSSGFCTQCQL